MVKRKIKPQVEETRDTKQRLKRVGAKREKGGALVIKIKQSKYSDVLKAMRGDAKLVDLEADVRSIRRTRTGEMILELKRDKERKQGVEVRALTQEATLKVKNLDEVTEVEDLFTTLRQQCEM